MLVVSTAICTTNGIQDCFKMSEKKLAAKSEDVFDSVAKIPDIVNARIMDFDPITKSVEVAIIWSKTASKEKANLYLQTLRFLHNRRTAMLYDIVLSRFF